VQGRRGEGEGGKAGPEREMATRAEIERGRGMARGWPLGRGERFGWASAGARQRKGGFLLSLFYFYLFIFKLFSNQFETILNLAQNHIVQKYNAHECTSMF